MFSTPPARFDPATYVRGHRATSSGEIALIDDTAKKAGVDVGSTVGLVTLAGLKRLRVSGIYRIGTTASLGGALVSSIPLADAQHWYSLDGKFTQVNLQAGAGRVQHDLPRPRAGRPRPQFKVQTGSEKAKADSKGIADIINGFLGPALLAFGGVAVLVGAFIIFNMFSITVAQRIREIAMLRTLGASRKQILTSVLLEALTTGLIGTVIGIFAGLLIALGINALFDAVGFGGGTPVSPARGRLLGIRNCRDGDFRPAARHRDRDSYSLRAESNRMFLVLPVGSRLHRLHNWSRLEESGEIRRLRRNVHCDRYLSRGERDVDCEEPALHQAAAGSDSPWQG